MKGKFGAVLFITALLGCIGYLLYLLSKQDDYLFYLKKYIALQDIEED